jgi:hypothetical protein
MGGEMKEVIGNLWFYYDKGATAVITTNGYVKRDGRCVMGRGTYSRGYCLTHYSRNFRTNSANKEVAKKSREYQAKIRANVIAFLGGKCIRCSFSDPRALQIDHRYGGGTAARRSESWGKFYKIVLANPHPYQLLCANCNWIKRVERREHVGRPTLQM